MVKQADVLIIGAGAAGLMAAMHISRQGKKVIVLEARTRLGGRINTVTDARFENVAEGGAEFVHGELPVTLGLLNLAGIPYHKTTGQMWQYHNGIFSTTEHFIPGYNVLMDKLAALKVDMSLNAFLDAHFEDDEYADLKNMLRGFAEGYDTADPDRASVIALRDELLGEDDEHQYRVDGGYKMLVNYLEQQVLNFHGIIKLSAIVKEVQWLPGRVKALTSTGEVYVADKIVITLPPAVLLAPGHQQGAVSFSPAIPLINRALSQLGMGAVVKILLGFDEVFWEDAAVKQGADAAAIKGLGYLFTDEPVPTWWTQVPQKSRMLTGWVGGPPARQLEHQADEQILSLALNSLQSVFKIDVAELRRKLTAFKIINWTADPFTLGSYSYTTVTTAQALAVLMEPVSNTLYFAGEAIYNGPSAGTVEAALTSGLNVARKVLL